MDKNIRCSYTKNIPVINLLTVKQLLSRSRKKASAFETGLYLIKA